MPMTMTERATRLAERLKRVHALRDNVVEAGALSQLRAELAPLVQKSTTNKGRIAVLSAAGIEVPQPVSVSRLQQRAAKLREDFSNEPTSITLKRGQTWVTMITEGETAAQELTTAAKLAWQAHRTNLYAGKAPAVLEAELAKTASNQATIREYTEIFNQFRFLFDAVPATLEVIVRAKKLAERLETIASKFDFQVSPPIKAFLDAVQSIQGAQLTLLTEEVIDWLRENKTLNGYRIKAVDRT